MKRIGLLILSAIMLVNMCTEPAMAMMECSASTKTVEKPMVEGEKSVGNRVIIEKIQGQDKYELAAKVSEKLTYESAILVNTDRTLADGLSASGLAGVLNAPILLTQQNNLPKATLDRLTSVKKIYLIGGSGAIGDDVKSLLEEKGIEVVRISGNDRLQTSYNVAKEVHRINPTKKVLLANGFRGEADAMSIAPVAVREKAPIILTDGNVLPFALNNLECYAIGGTGVISDKLAKEAKATRLGGKDRFATNKMIINKFYSSVKEFHIVKSDVLVNALVGSTIAKDAPTVLVGTGSNKSILKDATKLTIVGDVHDNILQECYKAVEDNEEVKKPMSMEEFKMRLLAMGFDVNGNYKESIKTMGRLHIENKELEFVLYHNSVEFDNVIKTCFNMLLPTRGDELYYTVCKAFKDQEFEMDGRRVVIKQFPICISVNIYDTEDTIISELKPINPGITEPMSIEEFESKIPSTGVDKDGFYRKNKTVIGKIKRSPKIIELTKYKNDEEFDEILKKCFGMLLPTTGNILHDIVSNVSINYKIGMDGRTVEMKQIGNGVMVLIIDEPYIEASRSIKPEVTKPMSMAEFKSKVTELGFTESGGFMDDGHRVGQVGVLSDCMGFAIHMFTPEYNRVLKKSLNMLLPTKGNELFDIITKPFKEQTLYMDGREVFIKKYPEGIVVDISDK